MITPGSPKRVERRSAIARLLVVLAVVGLGFVAVTHLDLAAHLDPTRIESLLTAAGPFAPLVLAVIMAVVVVSPIPSFPFDIAAGVYFGPWLGTLYAAAGAALGAVAAFQIARWSGRDLVERLVRGHISFCTACSDKLLTRLIFVTRLIPLVSFKVVSYGAGLTNMSVGRFALATFFGMLPLTFVYVSAGRLLLGEGLLPIAGGMGVIVALLVLPMAIERFDILGLRNMFRHDPPAHRNETKP